MDPSEECKKWRPCPISHHHHHLLPCPHHCHHHHHHHHHHHPLVLCSHRHIHHHHHHHLRYQPHRQPCPTFAPLPFQNHYAPVSSEPLRNNLNSDNLTASMEAYDSGTLMFQEDEYEGLGEEDDEELMFVLTEEWREFFAKSEAKRKLEKKLAKKKGKG